MQDGANDAFTGQEQEQQKPRYTIVCDFHDTLSKGGEIDTSLLRALLILKAQGHEVVFASSDWLEKHSRVLRTEATRLVAAQSFFRNVEGVKPVDLDALEVCDKFKLLTILENPRNIHIFLDDNSAVPQIMNAQIHLDPGIHGFQQFVSAFLSNPAQDVFVLAQSFKPGETHEPRADRQS